MTEGNNSSQDLDLKGDGGGNGVSLVDGNGTTFNALNQSIDWGGVLTNNVLITGAFDIDFGNGGSRINKFNYYSVNGSTRLNGDTSTQFVVEDITPTQALRQIIDTVDGFSSNISHTKSSIYLSIQNGVNVSQFNILPTSIDLSTANNFLQMNGTAFSLSNEGFTFAFANGLAGNHAFTDNSTVPKGIIYAADYSANFVDDSLITKRYVDAQVAGAALTNGSGTTANGTAVDLGGALTANALVNGGGAYNLSLGNNVLNENLNIFEINAVQGFERYASPFPYAGSGVEVIKNPGTYDVHNRQSATAYANTKLRYDSFEFNAVNGTANSYLRLDPSLLRTIISDGATGNSARLDLFNTGSLLLQTVGQGASLTFDTPRNTFKDNNTVPAGLEYFTDYSANYTDRSLVDKAYVLSVVSSSVQYQGGYDATAAPNGSATTGFMYTVTVAGDGGGFWTARALEIGDVIIAEVDNPATDADWTVVNKDLDAASIKTSYESNPNTNAFEDAEKTKLAGIEAGATADQTDAEIKTAYENNANTNAFEDAEKTKLAGIEAGAEVNPTLSKTATVLDPAVRNICLFRTDVAITIAELIAVTVGTGPNVTLQLQFGPNRDGTGSTNMTTSGVVTNTTTGNVIPISVASVPANSWVFVDITAVVGATELSIDFRFTED